MSFAGDEALIAFVEQLEASDPVLSNHRIQSPMNTFNTGAGMAAGRNLYQAAAIHAHLSSQLTASTLFLISSTVAISNTQQFISLLPSHTAQAIKRKRPSEPVAYKESSRCEEKKLFKTSAAVEIAHTKPKIREQASCKETPKSNSFILIGETNASRRYTFQCPDPDCQNYQAQLETPWLVRSSNKFRCTSEHCKRKKQRNNHTIPAHVMRQHMAGLGNDTIEAPSKLDITKSSKHLKQVTASLNAGRTDTCNLQGRILSHFERENATINSQGSKHICTT